MAVNQTASLKVLTFYLLVLICFFWVHITRLRFDHDWKKIEAFVGSKTVIQIRSHAQKYFLKVQKNGTSEHVPPPRPKRKAAHPYPQKAPKTASVVPQVAGPYQSSSALHEPGYTYRGDSSSTPGNPIATAYLSSWSYNSVPPVTVSQVTKDDAVLAGPTIVHNSCYSSSSESTPRTWSFGETIDRGDHWKQSRVLPDFAEVYSFIGSVFDPGTSGHFQKLKQMDPINLETVLLLMRNLSVNLTSPDFEDHIWEASFSCPSWFSSGPRNLIKRILDPNPLTV